MSRLPVAAGLIAGAALDDLFGDPRRTHPVAAFGGFARALECRWYADSRAAGVAFTMAAVAPIIAGAAAIERATVRRPVARTAAIAAATWVVLGGRSLRRTGLQMADHLEAAETDAARGLLPSLCGRDPDSLDETGLTRASLESIAENTSDSVVAPLFWGAVAGLPGLLGYRAVNTLDAMVGHRSPRYARFGTAAARLDDAANLIPSRMSAALTLAAAPAVSGSPAAGWRVWRADAHLHPSPNAGQCEAATAGVLGVQLGGPTVYAGRTEFRPTLGTGRAPSPGDLRRSVSLSRRVQSAALVVLSGLAIVAGRR